MTLRDELTGYAERSADLIEESPQMDEENTKRKIVEPLVDCLGWDILSSDVELEYSVQMGAGTKKVDYALKLEERPVVFVEAKGCDTTLEESHENQLKSYMRQVGVDWGLLTNGRQFEIFRRDVSGTRPNEIALAEFDIEEVPENDHPLKALSRHSIESGEAEQIAEKIEAVQRAVESLRKNKEDLAEDLTAVVTKVAGNAVSQQVEDEAKGFVDALIETLAEQAHHETSIQTSSVAQVESTSDEYIIRVLRDGEEVHRVADELQSDAMGSLVSYLINHEGLLEEIEIPYYPGTGRGSRVLLNDKPNNPDGTDMKGSMQVSGGYYLLTHLSKDDKMRYVSELPEKVGLDCEFVGAW